MQFRTSRFACRLCLTLAAFFVGRMAMHARDTGCPVGAGNPAASYLVPGAVSDLKYRGEMTLDAYAPPGAPRQAAILIHGGHGDKPTHLTTRVSLLEPPGFSS